MRVREAAGEGASGLTLEFVAKGTLIVIGLVALANGLWLAREVLFIAFFALLVASFLSIFVEPAPAAKRVETSSQDGTTAFFSRPEGDQLVSVLGEVPLPTAQLVARSVTRRP